MKINRKILFIIIFFALAAMAGSSYAQDVCDPSSPNFQNCFIERQGAETGSPPLGARTFLAVLQNIGGFLMIAGGLVAFIVIIVAGFMWMAAGSDTGRLTAAKALFKNGVIGALILFASGVIINTVILLATSWSTFFS